MHFDITKISALQLAESETAVTKLMYCQSDSKLCCSKNTQTCPREAQWKFEGGGGGWCQKPTRNMYMKMNWNFERVGVQI